MRNRLLMLIGLLVMLLPSAAAHAVDTGLKTNPFEPPVSGDSDTDQEPEAQAPVPEMVLLGTMDAGRNSLADIGGEILAVGQEVSGYTLVAVHPYHVVLQKDAIQRILSIDKDAEKQP
ncbi:MAG: hypothetical protein QNL87_10405 [Gammaproteobacteria bacterium]|nr:hypothetical protein [Gammaproteobacteria bacterium]